MIFDLYLKIPRRIKILAIFLFIILLVYAFARILFGEPTKVPLEFLQARQDASAIAQEIVSLSGQITNNIGEISNLDKEHKYTEALNLISRELERNRQAREKAVLLSGKLEIMTKNLSGISPASSSQKALEAVSSEVSLISRLITYNDYLVQLLEILRSKFFGHEKNSSEKIYELIQKINDEVRAINDLNKKFNDTMEEFDSAIK